MWNVTVATTPPCKPHLPEFSSFTKEDIVLVIESAATSKSFLKFRLAPEARDGQSTCYHYSHDICLTVERSFDPAESCHCDNLGYQRPCEGHVQKSSLQNGLIYLCCMQKQKPILMLHLTTMPDMWRLFIAIKLAFVWWHQQTRPGRLNPAWTHLQCLWGRREEMKCFL